MSGITEHYEKLLDKVDWEGIKPIEFRRAVGVYHLARKLAAYCAQKPRWDSLPTARAKTAWISRPRLQRTIAI